MSILSLFLTPQWQCRQFLNGLLSYQLVRNIGHPAELLFIEEWDDEKAIVRNTEQFPTPVRPVGSKLSVTGTVVNDGGTLLCTRKLDAILGLETDDQGGHVVRVQAGYRLAIETLGGNPSPIQTQWLQPDDVRIPRKLARNRFTTPYYQQFLV